MNSVNLLILKPRPKLLSQKKKKFMKVVLESYKCVHGCGSGGTHVGRVMREG